MYVLILILESYIPYPPFTLKSTETHNSESLKQSCLMNTYVFINKNGDYLKIKEEWC